MVSGECIPGVTDAFGLLLPRRNKVTYDFLIQEDVVLFFSSNSLKNSSSRKSLHVEPICSKTNLKAKIFK